MESKHWEYPYEYSSPALGNSKLENCSTDTHNYMSVSRTEAREEQMKRWTDESPKSKNRIAEGARNKDGPTKKCINLTRTKRRAYLPT